jgi:hypothetical protein
MSKQARQTTQGGQYLEKMTKSNEAIAIMAALGIAGWISNEDQGGYANAFLMGGLAAPFATVWLRNAKPRAKIVTIVLAALAVASVFFASYTELFWPVAIIITGGYLLFTALRPKAV